MKAEHSEQESQTQLQGESLPARAAARHRTRNLLFWGYQALLLMVFFPTLQQWYQLSGQAVHYSHIILIPLVSAYLFYSNRQRIFADMRYSLAGVALLVAGLAAFGWGRAWSSQIGPNDALAMAVLSILMIWAGGFSSVYGMGSLRKAAFPTLFLLFAVPIPTPALERIVSFLQQGSTEVTDYLFQISGTPFLREEFVFRLPGLLIEVAPECSGIRSSLALLITSVLAAHLFLRAITGQMLLVLVSIPITIFKNGVRIVSLSLLTIHVDEGFMSGGLHQRGGYPFFLFALVFLAIALWLLRRRENRNQEQIRGFHAKPQGTQS